MAKKEILGTITKEERILARQKIAVGCFPGMNRARVFKDRRKEANKQACRNWGR